VWTADAPTDTLRAYVQTYLKEEIQAEALVRSLSGFARFLPIAALCHGQIVNVSNLARDAGVARTTVHGFLEILEDTLLAFRVPGYEARLRVRERKHPKLYWIDAGLARAAKGQLGPVSAEERGPLLEGFVAMVLRCYGETEGLYDEMSYWAPAEGATVEVDFLLRSARSFVAIEVKASRRVRPDLLAGLRAIAGLGGLRRRLLVYLGDMSLVTEDGIEVFTLPDFLALLQQRRLVD
jgi:predicted AAA+ superfamily ATPase